MKKNEYLSGRGDDIRILGLSSSLYNTLKKDNINTVGELIMECNHNHFVDNISKSDIKEIEDVFILMVWFCLMKSLLF